MKYSKVSSVIVAGSAAAVLSLGGVMVADAAAPSPPPQPPQPVTVENDSTKPVPVQGAVDVGNLPASQKVEGTVDVGNLPVTQQVQGTVNVGNTLPLEPLTTGCRMELFEVPGGDFGRCDIDVPSGKRVVIETISAHADIPSSQHIVQVVFQLGPNPYEDLYLNMHPQGPYAGTRTTFTGTEQVRAYVNEPGRDINIYGHRNSSTGNGYLYVTVSGYLVPAP